MLDQETINATHDADQAVAWPRWFRALLVIVGVVLLSACSRAHGQELAAPCDDGCPVESLDGGETCDLGGGLDVCPIDSPAPCIVPCEEDAPGPADEYLCDGGDSGSPAGVRADWRVEGLEPEDTIAHYDTLDGRVIVTPSNRVCIYAPRFAAVRRVVNLMESEQLTRVDRFDDPRGPIIAKCEEKPNPIAQNAQLKIDLAPQPPSLFRGRQQAGELVRLIGVQEIEGIVGPYCNLQVIKLGLMDNAEKPWLAKTSLAAITWAGDQAPQIAIEGRRAAVMLGKVGPGVVYHTNEPHDPCLRLIKCASTDNALPGEEVEFTLRYDNVGDTEIGNVTIEDNLTARLAYVADSAKSSRDANFSTRDSESGSLILRWEICEPLKPGDGGVLTFRTTVR